MQIFNKRFYLEKKIIIIMKLSFLFIFFVLVQLSATSYSQYINLDVSNMEIRQVIKTIEQQSDYRFFYTDGLNDLSRKVNLKLTGQSIDQVLTELFNDTQLNYRLVDNKLIMLAPKSVLQQITITGTVTDDIGESIPGVNVTVKGTLTGVITGADGRFSINVPSADAVLVFSFVGYATQEFAVGDQRAINVTLIEDTRELEEVVVIGYGTIKKRDLTGSVSSVSSAKLQEGTTFSTAQALQGKAAGVTVMQTNSKPGSDAEVSIRGNRSLKASNTPLYVLDGIPLQVGISEISSSDIESIDILKDASATAIYGSRGANGVVLITTKKGKAGKAVVDYNGYYGFQNEARKVRLLNGAEWMDMLREANRTSGHIPSTTTPTYDTDLLMQPLGQETDPFGIAYKVKNAYDDGGVWHPERLVDIDWMGHVLRTGIVTNHEISARGGTDKLRILGSATYYDEKGLLKTQDYMRYSVRVNFDWNVSDYVTIGGQNQFSHFLQNNGPNVFDNCKWISPLANIYDQDGNIINRPGNDSQIWNPLLNISEVKSNNKKDRFLGSYYLEIQLPWDFRYRTNVGIDVGPYYVQEFYNKNSSDRQGGAPRALNSGETRTMWTVENLLYWNKNINRQSFGLTLLQSIQKETYESFSIGVTDLPYPTQLWYNVGSSPSSPSIVSEFQKWQMASFMGRINYSLMDKYLLTASLRYDGSSRLATGHQWVAFPSAAFAWRISEENFLRDVSAINMLKLRLGYGITGSQAIDPYKAGGSLNFARYNYGNENVMAFYPLEMPNPNLTWEETTQWNAGLDFTLVKGRVNGIIDLYLQNTEKLLMDRQLPMVGGYNSVVDNIGKTRNKGIEITLNTINIKTNDFEWSTDLIYTSNKEEIVELYNGKEDDPGNSWFIGHPTQVYYDYKSLGVWQLEEEELAKSYGMRVGQIKVADLDAASAGRITSADRTIVGTQRPKFAASLSSYFKYKNLDFNFFLNSVYGTTIKFDRNTSFNGRYNSFKVNFFRITEYDAAGNPVKSNGSNEAPRPNRGEENPAYNSAMFYHDASFLRISNVTLGYTLPLRIVNSVGIQRLRVYGTVQNLYCFTKFVGSDPESGQDFNVPMPRTILFGINLTL